MPTIFVRGRQLVTCFLLSMAKHHRPHCVAGPGTVLQLPAILQANGCRNPLLVTTEGTLRRGTLAPLFASLEKMTIGVTVFTEVIPDPTVACVEMGVYRYRAQQCDAIVAVGGGSVLDCAKAIGARIARPTKTLQHMYGMLRVAHPLPLLLAVPTTAGSGSEATAAVVLTDCTGGGHRKYPICDLCLVPRYAILDPLLTVPMPPALTAQTGMDALTHAIEAYINLFASAYVKKQAQQAVQLIHGNLYAAFENGANIAARALMQKAAYQAGLAFSNHFVGYVHALAHGVGALYGVPHGLATSVLLPVVLRAYGSAVTPALAYLAKAIGLAGESEVQRANAFLHWIETLREQLKLPCCFPALREKDFEELTMRAIQEANPNYPVPVLWNKKDFFFVLRAVLPCMAHPKTPKKSCKQIRKDSKNI